MLKKIFPLMGILVVFALALPTDLTAPTSNNNPLKTRENTPGQVIQKINMPPIQNAADVVVISQNFDTTWSTATPPTGWTIRYDGTLGASDWGRNNYTWGVGSGNASIYWSPSETGDDSMYTPAINLTGFQNVVFNCTSYYDHYSGAYTAQFRGSIDGGATYPYLIYDFNQTTQTVGLHIALPWAGNQSNVKILFLGSGYTFNMNWWAVDEFSVTADPQVTTDLATIRIVGPTGLIPAGPVTPQAWVKNTGTLAAVACSAKFDITPGYTNTQPVPALLSGDSALISFSSWTAASGSFATKCSTRLPGDLFTGNDALTGSVNVAGFVHDFEANDANYTAPAAPGGTPPNLWQWGTATVGPPAAHSPTKLWGTNLTGYYSDNDNWWLVSRTYVALANNPTIMYYDWYYTEPSWDGYNLAYSTNNGQSWTLIASPTPPYNYTNVYGLGEPGYAGTQTSWQLKTLTVPVNNGQLFQIRWRFGSDASVSGSPYAGVYIDDVAGINCAPFLVTNDVGVSQILEPAGNCQIGATIQPKGLVKNYGIANQTNVPVTCWIESLGVQIYSASTTVNVLAGDTATATFSNWTVGPGPQYDFTMFTDLSTDSVRLNDTLRSTVDAIPWGQIAQPPATIDRLSHGLAYDPVNDKIYMMGGTPDGSSGSNVNLMQQYDPVTNTWATMAPMPTAKGWIDGVYCRGKVYAIGGYSNSGTALNENAEYNIATNTWTTRAVRPRVAACDLEVVWRDSLIYVMGGTNLSIGWNFVDVYNPFSNTWSLATPLPQPGDMGSAVIIGDTIYIPNALNRGSSSCWANFVKGAINPANPLQITWITDVAHTYPTFDAGSAVGRGNPYWLGGFLYASTVTNQSWYYDRATGTIVDFYNYVVPVTRCCYMVERPAAREMYIMAGDQDGNWAAPNQQYYKITFPPTHDVGCTKLIVPSAVGTGASVTPACTVYNYGDVAEDYRVRLKIGTVYDETLHVAAHAIGTPVGLTFPAWTAVTGNYTVTCSTELGTDINKANDRQTSTLIVNPIATNWEEMTPVPTAPSGKNPKAGSCMAGLDATGVLYFLKASKTPDFYAYTPDPGLGTWADLTPMPIGDKVTGDGKDPKKGAAMAAYEPKKSLYVVRGNNTLGFWKYQADTVAATDTIGWTKLANIPEGAKKVKYGTGLVAVPKGGNDYLFCMKGAKTSEFYLYDIAAGTWAAVASAPTGMSGKTGYKKGSCLAYDGSEYVYVLQGYYGSFFRYKVEADSWAELKWYDYKTYLNRDGKKKKFKDGAAMVYYDDYCYVMKGGNTQEVWKYSVASDSWGQMEPADQWDIPLAPSGKKVKDGGYMTMFANYFWASKGKNRTDFYRHALPVTASKVSYLPTNEGVMGKTLNLDGFKLTIAPNPAINVAAVRYSLPVAGPVTMKLYNVTGALVKSHAITNPTKEGVFLVNELPAGVYILRFNSGDIRVTRKLVLER